VRTQLDPTQTGVGFFQLEDLLTLVQADHYGVLLDSKYIGPGDVTQHYFYAGILLVPLALLGWPMCACCAWRSCLACRSPGMRSDRHRAVRRAHPVARLSQRRAAMHGWFLPALGLAVLAGAGLATLQRRLPLPVVVALVVVLVVDICVFNSLQNRLTFARDTAEHLYLAPLREFSTRLSALNPPVQRLYGQQQAAVVYRNHALQSRVETTYGYNRSSFCATPPTWMPPTTTRASAPPSAPRIS